ncbi:m-AAA protease-interacting protein 1, mitochondrial [Scomber japonicus]|uniref:m-AAA protease-interacting protein 1, mitochondrial n=1 Tax=Scomber japonicus TaxID=13676 RepID=UPI002305D565|nr:m-AAA protease-interacting protein 1, mitochondrial [Scomber japonicus]
MQRITSLAAGLELGGLAACTPGVCTWKRGPTCSSSNNNNQLAVHRLRAGVCVRPERPFSGEFGAQSRGLCRTDHVVFAGQKHRLFSSQPGAQGPQESPGGQPGAQGPQESPGGQHGISVVGSPDPITWIRCKVIMWVIRVYFEVDIVSAEFDRGVKQAFVHVSNMMSSGRYWQLRGVVSKETVNYIEKKCRPFTKDQQQQLAVSMDDIIFLLPEDVSVVFDQYGRKFCFIVMRFWFLSTHEGPEDPEATKIFKVSPGEDGSPQKKIATAVYEFQTELTMDASPDWTVTTVWHWHWKLFE